MSVSPVAEPVPQAVATRARVQAAAAVARGRGRLAVMGREPFRGTNGVRVRNSYLNSREQNRPTVNPDLSDGFYRYCSVSTCSPTVVVPLLSVPMRADSDTPDPSVIAFEWIAVPPWVRCP
ncbi:hypothetical protein Nans01_12300 [Nocardiopsis ansamitocini]|uniref:Uncharacterized protein n=1 Tax=Nocardiopsis ansamitocini TaxID=1670832 RepID=A0A9W6UHQ8_9ACTN|nr:hypothetical protein Nans01_12300 [Nocardiopsis ansamitocini]